jgi:hypothetical protein
VTITVCPGFSPRRLIHRASSRDYFDAKCSAVPAKKLRTQKGSLFAFSKTRLGGRTQAVLCFFDRAPIREICLCFFNAGCRPAPGAEQRGVRSRLRALLRYTIPRSAACSRSILPLNLVSAASALRRAASALATALALACRAASPASIARCSFSCAPRSAVALLGLVAIIAAGVLVALWIAKLWR